MESTSGLLILFLSLQPSQYENLGDMSSKAQNIQTENPIPHPSSASASTQLGEEEGDDLIFHPLT